jgi:hypothetical protein
MARDPIPKGDVNGPHVITEEVHRVPIALGGVQNKADGIADSRKEAYEFGVVVGLVAEGMGEAGEGGIWIECHKPCPCGAGVINRGAICINCYSIGIEGGEEGEEGGLFSGAVTFLASAVAIG